MQAESELLQELGFMYFALCVTNTNISHQRKVLDRAFLLQNASLCQSKFICTACKYQEKNQFS